MFTKNEVRQEYAVLLLILALILAGCRGNPTAPSEATPVVPEATRAQPASSITQAVEAPTEVPSPTTAPATATSTQAPPTATPTAEPTQTPTPAPPTDTPTSKPTETPTPAPPDAVVKAPQLNVRSGPGTAFDTVATLAKDDPLEVIGQSSQCDWLQVRTAGGIEGWVARVVGGTEYTTLNISCESVPEVVVPTPTARPKPTSPPAAPTSPPAAATATPQTSPDLGCYLIQNLLGVELTFTFEAVNWSWRETFRVPAGAEKEYCLGPGRYTYTIDAPPPWSSINGILDVEAGDRLVWPIRGR